MAAGRYPIFVLHLTLPTEAVDINVHPQKREVRLQGDLALKEMVFNAVNCAFHHRESAPSLEITLPAREFVYEPFTFPEIRFEKEPDAPMFLFEPEPEVYWTPKILTTLNRFIVIKTPEDQLALVDQKAARARIGMSRCSKRRGRIRCRRSFCPTPLR